VQKIVQFFGPLCSNGSSSGSSAMNGPCDGRWC